MTSDSQLPPVAGTGPANSDTAPPQPTLLAPWWHTALLVVVLLVASLNGLRGRRPMSGSGKLLTYIWGMIWEWILVGFVWLGTRKRMQLRELIGGRWNTPEDFLLDVVFAGTFWVIAMMVLGGAAKLMHLDDAAKIDSMRRSLGFLTPGSSLELAVWFCLSLTAGFCEELIFRGYLQRQFIAITRSSFLGVLVSAAIFGAAHGYEGVSRMVLIGIFGFLFGLLAWWRKSLRPGMMAHAWHDALSGAILRVMK